MQCAAARLCSSVPEQVVGANTSQWVWRQIRRVYAVPQLR